MRDWSSITERLCFSASVSLAVSESFSSSFRLSTWLSLSTSFDRFATVFYSSLSFLANSSRSLTTNAVWLDAERIASSLRSKSSLSLLFSLRIWFSRSCRLLTSRFIPSISAIRRFSPAMVRSLSLMLDSNSEYCSSADYNRLCKSCAIWSSSSRSLASCLHFASQLASYSTLIRSFSLSRSTYCPTNANLFSYSTALRLISVFSPAFFLNSSFYFLRVASIAS